MLIVSARPFHEILGIALMVLVVGYCAVGTALRTSCWAVTPSQESALDACYLRDVNDRWRCADWLMGGRMTQGWALVRVDDRHHNIMKPDGESGILWSGRARRMFPERTELHPFAGAPASWCER